ncbi:hypothetical protein ACIQWL_42180 [Streptomyces mirabilis]|uniref:hypothetical protein n=1 Tax=Streptomyces mirabilis TaxID=68239 RepID=UPI00382CE062
MNPHDPAKRPGAHLIAEEFGVEDPWALSDNRPLRDPLDLVGRMVAEAARDVDELHGELARAAQSAIDLLAPIAQGDHAGMRGWYGVLRTTGPQIELLVARRGAAYEQLTRSISTFRRLMPEQDAARPSKAAVHDLGNEKEQAPGRDDDWAISVIASSEPSKPSRPADCDPTRAGSTATSISAAPATSAATKPSRSR